MLHFPSPRDDWQLDAVAVLAVLGEKNISLNAHLILSSRTCLLPRLLPAPQGLYADRLDRLPTAPVKVTGVVSGNARESLSYFGELLHGTGNELPDFSVREIRLKLKKEGATFRLRWFAPLNVIAVVSFLLSIGMLVWAAIIRDGTAVVGIILLSFTTAILCATQNWSLKPRLGNPTGAHLPRGDVVLRSVKGCFTVIHCDEPVARMIYFGPEEIVYLFPNATSSRVVSGIIGGLTLTIGILMLSNAGWTMHVALAVTYAVLNAAYWAVSVLPPRFSWDLSCVDMEHTMHTDESGKKQEYETQKTFTRALYQAIRYARTTEWVLRSGACPNTPEWGEWLRQVGEQLLHPSEKFDPQEALSDILAQHKSPV